MRSMLSNSKIKVSFSWKIFYLIRTEHVVNAFLMEFNMLPMLFSAPFLFIFGLFISLDQNISLKALERGDQDRKKKCIQRAFY